MPEADHVDDHLTGPHLLPEGWDPVAAGKRVMAGLGRVTAPHVKGAHDAEFVCVGDRAYIVEHDNDVQFESPNSFQYPTFHEHAGAIWLTVTQGEKGSTDRILFGRLEDGPIEL